MWIFKLKAIVQGWEKTSPQDRANIARRLDRSQFFEVLQELASAGGYMVCLCAGHPKPPPNGATVVPSEREDLL